DRHVLDDLIPAWQSDSYYNEGMAGNTMFDKMGEECGVFGVFGHTDASFLSYYALHALQHRGQESAGICVTDGEQFHYYRNMGLVKEVFDNEKLKELQGSMGI